MGNVISTNVASINAQRNLFGTNTGLTTTFQRLSSGFRINSAKDDASGLFISNQLSSQIGGLTIAARNANDGISLGQVTEGGLQEVTNILLRMRDLAVQAASGQTADGGPEKGALNAEYQQLSQEVTRIAAQTKFGNTNVLNTGATIDIQVGVNSGETIAVTLPDVTGLNSSNSPGDVTTAANAAATLTNLDADIIAVDTARGALGAFQNRLSSTISNLNSIVENASASRSRIRDTDFAVETANLSKFQVLQQAGLSVLGQANASNQNVLSLLQG